MGAFEAEGLGGAGDVAVELVDFFEDVVALVGFAGLDEGGAGVGIAGAGGGGAAGTGGVGGPGVAEDAGGQVFALDPLDFGIEDEDALDEVAELADVAGPVALTERGEGVLR